MMVSLVELEADAYLTCLTHALTTEKEEVMGLLLGEVILYMYMYVYVHLVKLNVHVRADEG